MLSRGAGKHVVDGKHVCPPTKLRSVPDEDVPPR